MIQVQTVWLVAYWLGVVVSIATFWRLAQEEHVDSAWTFSAACLLSLVWPPLWLAMAVIAAFEVGRDD